MAVKIVFVVKGGDGTYLYKTTLGYKHWKTQPREATQFDSYQEAETEILSWTGGAFGIDKLYIITSDNDGK